MNSNLYIIHNLIKNISNNELTSLLWLFPLFFTFSTVSGIALIVLLFLECSDDESLRDKDFQSS